MNKRKQFKKCSVTQKLESIFYKKASGVLRSAALRYTALAIVAEFVCGAVRIVIMRCVIKIAQCQLTKLMAGYSFDHPISKLSVSDRACN